MRRENPRGTPGRQTNGSSRRPEGEGLTPSNANAPAEKAHECETTESIGGLRKWHPAFMALCRFVENSLKRFPNIGKFCVTQNGDS